MTSPIIMIVWIMKKCMMLITKETWVSTMATKCKLWVQITTSLIQISKACSQLISRESCLMIAWQLWIMKSVNKKHSNQSNNNKWSLIPVWWPLSIYQCSTSSIQCSFSCNNKWRTSKSIPQMRISRIWWLNSSFKWSSSNKLKNILLIPNISHRRCL